jgi:hypothetical protein
LSLVFRFVNFQFKHLRIGRITGYEIDAPTFSTGFLSDE